MYLSAMLVFLCLRLIECLYSISYAMIKTYNLFVQRYSLSDDTGIFVRVYIVCPVRLGHGDSICINKLASVERGKKTKWVL